MNTSTLLGRPLLLVVVLAVTWAAAVPLKAVSGKEDLGEDIETFLRRRRDTSLSGSVAHQVNPGSQSVTATGTAEKSLGENQSIFGTGSATRTNVDGLGSFNTFGVGGGLSYSPNDNTELRAGAHRVFNPNGHTITGVSGTLEHSLDNKHSLSAGIQANKHDFGFDSVNTHRADVNYNFTPNKDTVLSLGAHGSSTPFGGRDFGFGLTGTHFFGG